MHVATYYASRRFLSAYHLFHRIEEICKHDDEKVSPRTAVEDRSAGWLVTRYLYLYDQNREEGINQRHVHRSEIYHLLGKHALFLLTKFQKRKIVGLRHWRNFCSELKGRKFSRESEQSIEEIVERWGRGERDPAHIPFGAAPVVHPIAGEVPEEVDNFEMPFNIISGLNDMVLQSIILLTQFIDGGGHYIIFLSLKISRN